MADQAVNSQRATIQDDEEFYRWSTSSGIKAIRFFFVTKENCDVKAQDIQSCKLPPVKGTMSFHACTVDAGGLLTATTSCYCDDCRSGNRCNKWSIAASVSETDNNPCRQAEHATQASVENDSVFKAGDFISGVYLAKWYIGEVVDVDPEDDELEIKFMEQKKKLFQWPTREDSLWLPRKDILCKIDEPSQTGKSGRMYRLQTIDLDRIEKLYSEKY